MFIQAYQRALAVIARKPMMLWGLSLLSGIIATIGGFVLFGIPAAAFVVSYLIACGMARVYIDGLSGKQVNADQLFACFNGKFLRVAGGLAWRDLWLIIWSLVPIVGPIIMLVKSYSYRFVPYILATKPEVTATQALKMSMKMTEGIKGQMFLADFCIGIIVGIIAFILGLLSKIPYVGILFALILLLFFVLVAAFSNIFIGLYQAYFYIYRTEMPQRQQPVYNNPNGYYQPQQQPQQPAYAPQQPVYAPQQQPVYAPQPQQAPQQPTYPAQNNNYPPYNN